MGGGRINRDVLDPAVEHVVAAYLALVDAELPGLIAGLYLVGSVSLGDYRPGRSDVDFVALLAGALTTAELDRLRAAHRDLVRTARRPDMEGVYATANQLRQSSQDALGISVAGGGTVTVGGSIATPVTWTNLASCPVVIRGPEPALLGIRADERELTRWALENLRSYWRRWLDEARRPGRLAAWTLGPDGVMWAVLGAARTHCTIATGRIVSKSSGGHYAREVFGPRWHRIVDEALRLRRGQPSARGYRNPLHRRRDALAFISAVIDDAERRFGSDRAEQLRSCAHDTASSNRPHDVFPPSSYDQ